jgi:hypothetical protein
MKRLAKEGLELERFELSPEEAEKLMGERVKFTSLNLSKSTRAKRFRSISRRFCRPLRGPAPYEHCSHKGGKTAFMHRSILGQGGRGQTAFKDYGVAFPKSSELETSQSP